MMITNSALQPGSVTKMDPKVEKLHEVFKTMAFGENIEDTSKAAQWLETVQIVDTSSEIDNILENVKENVFSPNETHLIRLAEELEKNVKIICEIEILSRGILSKDTNKALNILVQYFYYYASLTKNNGVSKDIAVGVFEDDHPLWLLGLFLGPALSTGHAVVLQAGSKFAVIITYVFELAAKVGIPKEALILVPSYEGELQPYFDNKNVSVIAFFVDLLNEKYSGINKVHKKVLVFSGYKTPALIFDNSDLDSAVENIVEAAWGYGGMLPWAINTILVQENIFKRFTKKLKAKFESVRIGNGNDKLADISYPSNPSRFQKLSRTVDKAKKLGIEVFQIDNTPAVNISPTLIIGSRVDTNNVLTAPEDDYTVTILPFRSIDEAVNLANNTRQGLAASVWSENVGLINEVAFKLKVANIWINCHGLFSPELPLCPLKDSGVGSFGARQGQTEYTAIVKALWTTIIDDTPPSFKNIEAVNNAISSAKNAGAVWSKSTLLTKIKVFLKLTRFIDENKEKFSEKLSKKWLDSFGLFLRYPALHISEELGTSIYNGYSVTSIKNPKGVLIIEMRSPFETHNVKLLLAALFEGNAVVLLNESPETLELYQELSKRLPSGLLAILPYNLDVIRTAFRNKLLNAYFSEENDVFGSMHLRDSKTFSLIKPDLEWEQAFHNVRVFKHVWSNIGQSSQCNL